MPRFGARKPKLNNEMFIKMRLNGGKGQMADLIQDDSESVGDEGDYFDPNAGQENTFGNNVKAWDGRGGKMPTFTRGTPVSFFFSLYRIHITLLLFSNPICRGNMVEELTDGEQKLIFGIREIEINHFYHLRQMKNE